MSDSRAQNEEFSGYNTVEREKEEPVVVVENGDTSESTVKASCGRNSPGHTPSSPPSTECSPSDGTTDTNLDNKIRFALNELDFYDSNHRTSNFSLPSTHNDSQSVESATRKDNGSVESDSSEEEEEACPNAMGYMPLPQEPDMDGDVDDGDCDGSEGSEGVHHVLPVQQQADGGSCDSNSRRDPVSCDTPGGGVEYKSKLSSTAEGIQEKSEEGSKKPASRLKDGMRLHGLLVLIKF